MRRVGSLLSKTPEKTQEPPAENPLTAVAAAIERQSQSIMQLAASISAQPAVNVSVPEPKPRRYLIKVNRGDDKQVDSYTVEPMS